jgi:hypothetical protein
MEFFSRDWEISRIEGYLQDFSTHKLDVLIYGPSGVGKTEIVYKFSAKNTFNYNNIILFDCTNQQALQNDIIEIASHLRIRTDQDSFDMMQQIYKTFPAHEKTLIIFDNMENSTDWFRSFAPLNRVRHIQIIGISTHDQLRFSPRNAFEIEQLSERESFAFMSSLLEDTNIPEDKTEKLTVVVGTLPITIAIAGNFIKTECEENREKGEDVVQRFIENHEKIIATATTKRNYLAIILKTISDSISNTTIKDAFKLLLNFLAYREEPGEILLNRLYMTSQNIYPQKTIATAINYLRKYSIIKLRGEYFILHNLVQLKLKEITVSNDFVSICNVVVPRIEDTINNTALEKYIGKMAQIVVEDKDDLKKIMRGMLASVMKVNCEDLIKNFMDAFEKKIAHNSKFMEKYEQDFINLCSAAMVSNHEQLLISFSRLLKEKAFLDIFTSNEIPSETKCETSNVDDANEKHSEDESQEINPIQFVWDILERYSENQSFSPVVQFVKNMCEDESNRELIISIFTSLSPVDDEELD